MEELYLLETAVPGYLLYTSTRIKKEEGKEIKEGYVFAYMSHFCGNDNDKCQ